MIARGVWVHIWGGLEDEDWDDNEDNDDDDDDRGLMKSWAGGGLGRK